MKEGKKFLKAFYASVSERDRAFLVNAEKYLKSEKQSVAVMIAGGYHTTHLKNCSPKAGTRLSC